VYGQPHPRASNVAASRESLDEGRLDGRPGCRGSPRR